MAKEMDPEKLKVSEPLARSDYCVVWNRQCGTNLQKVPCRVSSIHCISFGSCSCDLSITVSFNRKILSGSAVYVVSFL